MIKAILFDFDYTLGDREKYAYECYKTILSKHTDTSDPVAFEAVLQDCMIWDQQGDVKINSVKYTALNCRMRTSIHIGTHSSGSTAYFIRILKMYSENSERSINSALSQTDRQTDR